jgi:hypothetical protein
MWQYNRCFAFISVGVKEDHSINTGVAPPVFRIQGELHHRAGSLLPSQSNTPTYAQLYIYEPRYSLQTRLANNSPLRHDTVATIQAVLLGNHQYVPIYKHAFEILAQSTTTLDAVIRLRVDPQCNRHTNNLPTADEVAVILPDDNCVAEY